MPTTRRSSRKSSKGVQKATPQPRLPASGGESSPELTPAEKRKATMARNAEEARRLAAAEPDERDVRASDAEQDQQGRESEVDHLREKVRQYEELWEQRAALNERRAELDQRDDGLAKRRAVLTEAAQRLRALAPKDLPKDLGGHRANARRSEQGPEKDDGPIEEQPEWMTTLHTVMIYLIRKFLTDYHVTLPVFKNPELHLALTALIVEAKSLHFGGRTFHDVIDLIKLVETNCDSLTINLGSRVQDRARGYMSRLLLNMRQDLNSTLRTLCGHEALVESCVADFLVGVRHASALGLDLRALMLEELRKVLTDWNAKMRDDKPASPYRLRVALSTLVATQGLITRLKTPSGASGPCSTATHARIDYIEHRDARAQCTGSCASALCMAGVSVCERKHAGVSYWAGYRVRSECLSRLRSTATSIVVLAESQYL